MPRVVALVPAHNEQSTIARTVNSLLNQTVECEVVVISDNSTDNTVEVAKSLGATVYETVDNKHKKSGALNYGITLYKPELADDDIIVCVDADSEVAPEFVERAIEEFSKDQSLGGVSASYSGRAGGGLVGWYQRNEISRWAYDDWKANGKTVILSGAASAFTVKALRFLKMRRGAVYDINSITEDFELSMALLHHGFKIKKMLDVNVTTAVKESFKELHVQRLRWDRGINDNLIQYGWTKHTRWVWVRRLIYLAQCFATVLMVCLWSFNLLFIRHFEFGLFWAIVAGIIAIEKFVTLKFRGLQHRVVGGILIAEMPYDMFLQTSFVKSIWHTLRQKDTKWR